MSKPDTNQASEEELEFIVSGYRDINGNKFAQVTAECKCGRGGWVRLEKHPDVQSLIRNEKLKLLAEVRERVVGEDADVDAAYKIGFDNGQDATAHNELRVSQRATLNKLEAEL